MNFIECSVILSAALMLVAGCYCLMRTHHMLKSIVGIEIAMKAATMLIIFAGYINGNQALAEAFVITVIVVEVVVMTVACGIAVNIFKTYGSMDIHNLHKLKG